MTNTAKDRETTGIVIRTDVLPPTLETCGVVYFCSTCDPEGLGETHYGLLFRKEYFNTEEMLADMYRYCPHCGRKIDYTKRKEVTHQIDF